MIRPRLLLVAATTAAATSFVVPNALAKEGFHVYSYSKPKLGLSVSLVREEGSSKVTGNVTVLCASSDDNAITVSSDLKGKLKNEHIDLSGPAPTGGKGTATIAGKMTLKKFTGETSVRVPVEGAGICKVTKSFSAAHHFTTGG
jgi:hypothetical protein